MDDERWARHWQEMAVHFAREELVHVGSEPFVRAQLDRQIDTALSALPDSCPRRRGFFGSGSASLHHEHAERRALLALDSLFNSLESLWEPVNPRSRQKRPKLVRRCIAIAYLARAEFEYGLADWPNAINDFTAAFQWDSDTRDIRQTAICAAVKLGSLFCNATVEEPSLNSPRQPRSELMRLKVPYGYHVLAEGVILRTFELLDSGKEAAIEYAADLESDYDMRLQVSENYPVSSERFRAIIYRYDGQVKEIGWCYESSELEL